MDRLKTLLWYARRPSFWQHGVELVGRKLTRARRRYEKRKHEVQAWAEPLAVSAREALAAVGLIAGSDPLPSMPVDLLEEGRRLASAVDVRMGGAADLGLLYAATLSLQPDAALETGVAYGWSSLAILEALERNGKGALVSIDMPYPKRKNERWVGVVVPARLRSRWRLIRQPDRPGIRKGVRALGGSIGLAHYDSDKSYPGRMYAYPLLWDALLPGGLFISDDIQDNFAFRDFCDRRRIPFQIVRNGDKFAGLARKPAK
jgi:predicted O-methyltransferase YrrM